MTKPLRGRGDAPSFFGPKILNARSPKCAEPRAKVSRGRAARKTKFVDAIVGGARMVIAHAPREREKGIEIRIRVALASAGVLVWKHHVDNRRMLTGLGLGTSDLICVVPPLGRFLGIEVKRPGYSPSDVRPDQTIWLAMVRRFGGITGVATSVEEAMALVALARGEA